MSSKPSIPGTGSAPPPEDATEQLLRGEVQRITYQNKENGYSVLQVHLPDTGTTCTVVGLVQGIGTGAHIVARGAFKVHKKFGRQFDASSITETMPSTSDGLERYLASGSIKGIGPKTAKRLVEKFGAKIMDVIQHDPAALTQIPGINKKKAQEMQDAVRSRRDMHNILQFLVEHKISPHLAQKIHQSFGTKAVETICRDPYILARQMKGVGFITADSVAMNVGLSPESPQRLKAGLYYALEKAADDGHTHLPWKMLVTRATQLLGIEPNNNLEEALRSLQSDNFIIVENHDVFLRRLYKAETFCAEFIAGRCAPFAHAMVNPNALPGSMTAAEENLRVQFSAEQRHAITCAAQSPLMVVTGGPGCGKTTVVKGIVQLFQSAGLKILLAAPTGRAAQRLAQVCGLPASTIHRLLKYDPFTQGFQHGINDPLIADCIIVDECSMLDILLARDLFSAIPKNAVLILVGDKDQLPSVGPGRLFADIISIAEVPTIALTRLFRRSEESSINIVAHQINSGLVPEIPEPDGVRKSDAYFISRSEADEAAQLIEKLVAEQIPKKFGVDVADIQVLTPSNRGPLGTLALNQRLQQALNPRLGEDALEQEIQFGDHLLRIGDRVCQRVNNYQLDAVGVFNGDSGMIHSIDKQKELLVVELWDGRLVKYSFSDAHQLSLGYALTVHRSQGSEIPCVVLALHDSQYTLLERQLIYTGVTRAKKLLIVVGSRRALTLASKRTSSTRRCTKLRDMIALALEGPQRRKVIIE